jgi:tRNA pseudouridine38-40 synthase
MTATHDPAASSTTERVHRLLIAYDGSPFRGWQRQSSDPTVQLALEKAVATLWNRPIHVHGSGRTDTGVHALGQVATFTASKKFTDLSRLRAALNNNLPDSIRILKAAFAPKDFHARFSATGKEYLYRIHNHEILPPFEVGRAWHLPRPLDLAAIHHAASLLTGTHDFASFASNPGYARATTVRTLTRADLRARGKTLELRFRGDGFLYRMVRNLTGALVKVGHHRISVEEFATIFAARTRSTAPNTAPAHGLYLARVFYNS